MKALFLATTVAAIGLAAPVAAEIPGSASIITLGGSYARDCYLAADARTATDEALAACDQALSMQPLSERDRLATHVNRGILRMVRHDFANAKWDYDQAMAINPREPEIWLNMGVLRYTQGDSEGAVEMFEQAINLRTKAPAFAYYGRGLANEDTGNVKAAYNDLVMAQSLSPNWSLPAAELRRYRVVGR